MPKPHFKKVQDNLNVYLLALTHATVSSGWLSLSVIIHLSYIYNEMCWYA